MYFAVNDLILKRKQRSIEKNIEINQPLSEVSLFIRLSKFFVDKRTLEILSQSNVKGLVFMMNKILLC